MDRIRLEFPVSRLVHRHPMTIRVSDINYGQHLGHDSVVSLAHEARGQAWQALGFPEWNIDGLMSIVADLAVQYQGEGRLGDALVVETAIDSVSGKGLGVHHRLLRISDDTVLATLRVGLVFAGEQGLAEPSARASVAIEQAVSAMSSRVAN
ncbi:acyl-CoA thioesterase [Cobetia sp. 29-18-1]|uniref:acyl-CoA thioesterase n=1 Tax=Cobetia sp. 29-18-1 TaxID=3040018 RepID=UPI00244C3DD1|nr:acyl-CoA thioesterase [Cobetia sp. 29-18-1]MDH2296579.1 acyl-CoA thioesterase [Cobetia sp. 29-18-1]